MSEQKTQSLPATYVEGFHDEKAVRKMKYRKLGETGMEVSVLGFGASSLGSVFHDTDHAESIKVVELNIKSGVNYIDTAAWYGSGKSERVLGDALKNIPRQAYYISTKCGRYTPEILKMIDFSAERVLKSVDESLERLGLDYIDIMQIHDPEFSPSVDVLVNETLPALETARKAGKIKFIGMTGYPLALQKEIIEKSTVKIDTSLTYCHYSMNDTSLVHSGYMEFLKGKGIGLINASPISMGLLSHRGPPSWHPATAEIREACKAAAEYCEKQGVNISKLAMHFTLSNEDIPTTLVSTASLKRAQSNIDAVSEELTEKEKEVSKEIMEKFFKPLEGNEKWEGVEVAQYWEKAGKALMMERLYPKSKAATL